ncbi:MAG: hypothetical protein QOI42_317, partial [Frankiaceae bacterium]|nr:hypothetical protein [Frankiaceae bacterium]
MKFSIACSIAVRIFFIEYQLLAYEVTGIRWSPVQHPLRCGV